MTPKRRKLLRAWEVGRQGTTEEVEKKWGRGVDLQGQTSQLTSPSLVVSSSLFLLISVGEPRALNVRI